jgi:hypothetical protein
MITQEILSNFITAATSGDMVTMEYIFAGLTSKASLQLIRRKEYHEAFYEAVAHNHVDVLSRLIDFLNKTMRLWSRDNTLDPHSWTPVLPHGNGARALIKTDDYAACRIAAQKGYLDSLRDMVAALFPDDIKEMLVAKSYGLICRASESGVVDVFDYVISLAKNDLLIANMLTENLYAPLRIASYCDCDDMLKRLFTFHFVFAHAEKNGEIYDQYIEPFVQESLQALYTKVSTIRARDANVACDVPHEEAILYFHMMRWCIRRNEPRYFNDLRFLITFPTIRALLHTTVTPGYSNELLCLAQLINNKVAVEILLSVPQVRQTHQDSLPKDDTLDAFLHDDVQHLRPASTTSRVKSKFYSGIALSQQIQRQETDGKLLAASSMFRHQQSENISNITVDETRSSVTLGLRAAKEID